MATTVLRLLPSLELSQMIFLQSLAAEKLYNIVRDIEQEGWKEHRLPELLKAMRDNQQVPDEVLQFVNRYVATRLPHLGKRDDDRRALRITLSKLHPCIIVGTIGMIQNFYNILRELATHVAIDEAGLVPDGDLITLLAGLTRLHQVFLTGDKQQLPAYHAYIPNTILPYGFEGVLETMHRRNAVPCMTLTQSYRAHPLLTQCLSTASYAGQLKSMLNSADRTILTGSTLELPVQNAPIVLLDIPGHNTTAGASRCNPEQESAAQDLLRLLKQHIPTASIAVLCFYAGSKEALQQKVDEELADICTIDGFQGKESDITIIVTTRTTDSAASEDFSFVMDQQRITVALSRARHGMFLIGDLQLLLDDKTWRTFIQEAAKYTPICGARYITDAEVGVSRNGQLMVEPNGLPPLTNRYFEENDKWTQM